MYQAKEQKQGGRWPPSRLRRSSPVFWGLRASVIVPGDCSISATGGEEGYDFPHRWGSRLAPCGGGGGVGLMVGRINPIPDKASADNFGKWYKRHLIRKTAATTATDIASKLGRKRFDLPNGLINRGSPGSNRRKRRCCFHVFGQSVIRHLLIS